MDQQAKEMGSPALYRWIVVSHVCQHWRDVSLATRRLWRLIYLDQGSTSLAPAAIAFLERSRPLSISLYNEAYDEPYGPDLTRKFYASLEKERSRISSIFLKGMVQRFPGKILAAGLPNAVIILIHRFEGSRGQSPRFGDHPCLENLALSNVHVSDTEFPRLTHLYLSKNT